MDALEASVASAISHWHEFGPEHEFEKCVDWMEVRLKAYRRHKESASIGREGSSGIGASKPEATKSDFMGRDECGEEIFDDMEECSLCAIKTERRAGDDSLERLVRCARANSYTGIPSLVAVMLALPALHHMNGMEGIERLACVVIGVIIGWLAALWATCFLLKYGGSAPSR